MDLYRTGFDADTANQLSLQTYQSFFLYFKNDDRMKSLIQDWNKGHDGNIYTEYTDVVRDAYIKEAKQKVKDNTASMKLEITRLKDKVRDLKRELIKYESNV